MKKSFVYTCKHCESSFHTMTEGRVTCHECRKEIYFANKLETKEKERRICSRCEKPYFSSAKSGKRCPACAEEVWRLNHVSSTVGEKRTRSWHPVPTERGVQMALRRQKIKETGKLCKGCYEARSLTDFEGVSLNGCSLEFKSCISCRSRNPRIHQLNTESRKRLWEFEGKKCGSCGSALELDTKAHVDHCHSTGKIRSILCQSCNQALGIMNEDIGKIQSLLLYAKKITGQ